MLEMDIHQFARVSKIPLPIEYRQRFMSLNLTLEAWSKHYYNWLDEKNDGR